MSDYIVVSGIRIAKDFIPETFGRLTTIGPKFRLPTGKQGLKETLQVYQCKCGEVVINRVNAVQSNKIQSCGCLHSEVAAAVHTTHGRSATTEYKSWQCMRDRCNNQNSVSRHNYGGRGICVHPDWDNTENGFQNFFDYIGPKPTPEHSIDRHPDPNGNYEPGNVRWADSEEQNRNTRRNKIITHNGKTQCLSAWAEEIGVKPNTILYRLRRGWSIGAAMTVPSGGKIE